MGFKKGVPRLANAGRKKGVPNKSSQTVEQILNANDINLPQMILDLIPALEEKDQLKALLGLMDYVYPKRKAIELTSPEGQGFKVIIEDFSGSK